MFPDKLRVSSFPDRFPHYALAAAVSPLQLHWVKGVCMFKCNLPPALLSEWPEPFTCHSGNKGVERTPNNSQHKKLTLEKKIVPPLLPGFEFATFPSRVQRSYQQARYIYKYQSQWFHYVTCQDRLREIYSEAVSKLAYTIAVECNYGDVTKISHHHLIYPLTTDDFATSFLRFFLFSTALWDLANSRPGEQLTTAQQHRLSHNCCVKLKTLTPVDNWTKNTAESDMQPQYSFACAPKQQIPAELSLFVQQQHSLTSTQLATV